MKKIKHIINAVIWILAGLYFALAILVNLPFMQRFIGSEIAGALSQKLGTGVYVGRVDLGLFNRVIIDDVRILDQQGKQMLRSSRLSASFDYVKLAQGRIAISSAQLFGLKAKFYRTTAISQPNYQFALDSLSSKSNKKKSNLDLSISSLIIRHGALNYDQLDAPRTHQFNPKHLALTKISGHLVLRQLTNNSIDVLLKSLAIEEASGLKVNRLTFRLKADSKQAQLSRFLLEMPESALSSTAITATYEMTNGKLQWPSLQLEGAIDESHLTLSDLACFVPKLSDKKRSIALATSFSATYTRLNLKRLEVTLPREGAAPKLKSGSDAHLLAEGFLTSWTDAPNWFANIKDLSWTDAGLKLVAREVPDVVRRIGRLKYRGVAGGKTKNLYARGNIETGAGDAQISFNLVDSRFSGNLHTSNLQLGKIIGEKDLGLLATNIDIQGNLHLSAFQAKGIIQNIVYKKYNFRNVIVDGSLANHRLSGHLAINDPNISADAKGTVTLSKQKPSADAVLAVKHFKPSALFSVPDQWSGKNFSGKLQANFSGRNLNNGNGSIKLNNFEMTSGSDLTYHLDSLYLHANTDSEGHHVRLNGDFAQIAVNGNFDYNTFVQSLKNLLVKRLPSIQQLTSIRYRETPDNAFNVDGILYRSDWLSKILGVPLELYAPVTVKGSLDDRLSEVNATVSAPDFSYDNTRYRNSRLVLSTVSDTLKADASIARYSDETRHDDYHVLASACDNLLRTSVSIDNHARKQRLRGTLHTITELYKRKEAPTTAEIHIQPSAFNVGDTILSISPSKITYQQKRIAVDRFTISHNDQRLVVNGVASASANDSLTVDLHDVNVAYILDLLRFHTVEFSGYANGRASLSQTFSRPKARANLTVNDFCFEDGRMGTLYAKVNWNNKKEQIDIDAKAIDSTATNPNGRLTSIYGYVSPKRNDIELNFGTHNTRGEFLESFCKEFLNKMNLDINGDLRLWGNLSHPNLTGQAIAKGSLGVKSLNTVYQLDNDTVNFGYNEIIFPGCEVTDDNGAKGVISGSLFHQHLSRLSYDLKIKARNLLAYDWDGSDGSSFYGKIYASGDVRLQGKPGETNIEVSATPEKGSTVIYNASSPEAVSSHDFIHWTSRDTVEKDTSTIIEEQNLTDIPSDLHLSMNINARPDATLRVITDASTGDYLDLNGTGMIRATYYNKGGVELYGNYLVDHGIYKLTVQNIIHRNFVFQQGGTIAFGGNPYDAALNLQALYTINSVSLADLQLGNSFKSNNIRVDCLMNITGTPQQPKVDFSLDMPTVGSDAKQMIYSILNSEEEMNQQVLYLLAVGRFYSQGSNNALAEAQQQSQTSLAMQSILSGQISQQINNVLGTVIKNNNWNFGANISTGDEGWNNAEYEGLLSGRLFNNRLLVDGQFGYRDNANATTSFIGDFDIRYLIFPNGNFSIRVYNQTNDRYFTRNSLNTQGIGFVLKKDFNGWRDLFSRNKKIDTQSNSRSKNKKAKRKASTKKAKPLKD
ncbi:MAG: translocation/assembly module TamB domain-containing protein [Prevotella sp.]